VDLAGIPVVDLIPAHTSYVAGSGTGGATSEPEGRVEWVVRVPFGGAVSVGFQVTVADNLTGADKIENIATVGGEDTPPVDTPTEITKSFVAGKSADKSSVGAGDELTYTITVTNTGDVDYAGIVISDKVPAHTTLSRVADGGVVVDGELSWTVDVPFGESRSVGFTVVVDSNLTDVSSIRNVARVIGDDPDSPDLPEEETEVESEKSFVAEKSADKSSVGAGDELTYTITVTNTGDVDYAGIVITDKVPAHTTLSRVADGGAFVDGELSWTVDVPVGESLSVSFTVAVDAGIRGVDALVNIASVTGDDPENPETPMVITPVDEADIPAQLAFEADKTADKQVVKAGEELTYTITVTNTGDVDYDGIVVTDAIPEHTTYVDGSATAEGQLADGELVWVLDVPFAESRSVSFTVLIDQALAGPMTIGNVARVTGENPDNPEMPSVDVDASPLL